MVQILSLHLLAPMRGQMIGNLISTLNCQNRAEVTTPCKNAQETYRRHTLNLNPCSNSGTYFRNEIDTRVVHLYKKSKRNTQQF